MTPTVAASALRVPHSRIRELAEIAMTMDGVLKLYFGESNLPTPEYIKRAAQKAMADGFTFYTENAGLPSLRKALARYYQDLHAVELDPASEIVITASGVQALNVSIRCVLDPGDEALVLTPAWPNGASNVAMANAIPVEIAHPLVGDRYQIDFAALARAVTPRTRMLIYTSPSNPLGWVATVDEQRQLLGLLLQIRVYGDDDFKTRGAKAGGERRRFAKVAAKADVANRRIRGAQRLELFTRTVRAAVVNEKNFIAAGDFP